MDDPYFKNRNTKIDVYILENGEYKSIGEYHNESTGSYVFYDEENNVKNTISKATTTKFFYNKQEKQRKETNLESEKIAAGEWSKQMIEIQRIRREEEDMKAAEEESKILLGKKQKRDLKELQRSELVHNNFIETKSKEIRNVDYYMWNDIEEEYVIIGKYDRNQRQGGSHARIYKKSDGSEKEVSIATNLYIKK